MATRFLPASHAAAVRAAEALEALIPNGELENNPVGTLDYPATHADLARIANALESLVIDSAPTAGSGHLVTSGGVKNALDGTVRSVNFISPDANGDVAVTHVLTADNLTADDAQDIYGEFTERTTGGTVSLTDGNSWLGLIEGNSVRTGYVAESRNYQYTAGERSADPETGIVPDILSVSMNWNTFISAVSGASTTMTISYDGEAWNYTPGTYGLTVTGTPVDGDSIAIAYVAEERGTITNTTPSSFVSTGWNLYNDDVGYARVLKYSDTYGFKVGGTYTSLAFSTTIDGERTTITPDANGLFTIAEDGYVYVVGGNNTDTYVLMTWSDWESGYDGSFATYSESVVDFSSIMTQNFPNGLCSVGAVRDDIDFSNQTAHVRIERMAYSAENIATLEAAGRAYWYDDDYIYAVLETPVAVAFTLSNQVSAYDHGMEAFVDAGIPVYAHVLYGQNLKDKLRTDVLTISAQTLTSTQKTQARTNIGAADESNVIKKDVTDQTIQNSASGGTTTFRIKSTAETGAEAYLRADGEGGNLQLQKGNSTVQLDTYAMSDTGSSGYARLYTTQNGGGLKIFQFRQTGQFIDGTGRNLSLLSTTQNVGSSIPVSSTKGTISQKYAYRAGNVVSLGFVFTANQAIAANTDFGITASFTDATLKPAATRTLGGSNSVAILVQLTPGSGATASCLAMSSGAVSSTNAYWIMYNYVCVG